MNSLKVIKVTKLFSLNFQPNLNKIPLISKKEPIGKETITKTSQSTSVKTQVNSYQT
jgi:hypothetical protein